MLRERVCAANVGGSLDLIFSKKGSLIKADFP